MKALSASEIEDFLRRCRGVAVGIVGDVMLDRFVWGKVSRISPEAPVPVGGSPQDDPSMEGFVLGSTAIVSRAIVDAAGEVPAG